MRTNRNQIVELVEQATATHGRITPCSGKPWSESITYKNGVMVLWFNTPDGSTHILSKEGESK